MSMPSMPFSEVRAHLADTLREVELTAQPVLISRRGATAGVLMSWTQYQELTGAPDRQAGFAARLAHWRAEHPDAVADTAADAADPWAGVRDSSPGRDAVWGE